jgi:hypothetical protein
MFLPNKLSTRDLCTYSFKHPNGSRFIVILFLHSLEFGNLTKWQGSMMLICYYFDVGPNFICNFYLSIEYALGILGKEW